MLGEWKDDAAPAPLFTRATRKVNHSKGPQKVSVSLKNLRSLVWEEGERFSQLLIAERLDLKWVQELSLGFRVPSPIPMAETLSSQRIPSRDQL